MISNPMDFDIDNLDLDDSHSDGNNGGGDGDFTIFDFNHEVMICPNEARHIHHEGPIEGPPFGSLSTKQGLRRDHNVATVAIGTVQSDVGSSHPLNDFLCFGQRHDGDDAPRINELVSVLHDIIPTAIHIKIANASFESNHPIQIEALHVPEPNTAPTPTIVGSALTSKLHSQPQSQHYFLTQSIANTSSLVVPHEIRVGATLVATRNILRNVGREASRYPPTPSTSISLPRGQSTGRSGVGVGVGVGIGVEILNRRTFVRGTETRGL